jgi:hypothetical protein
MQAGLSQFVVVGFKTSPLNALPCKIQAQPTVVALSGNGVLSGVQKLRKPDADSETFFSETYLSG